MQIPATTEPCAAQQLLVRLQHSSDFPALSAAVARIQRLTGSESENLHTLAAEILKDVALTQKLLRLVNTAQFSHAGAGTVGTVSRAVALIGFGGVRNLALSLVLLEHLSDREQASRLRHEYLRALLSAALAGELSQATQAGEEAFVGTLFQSLARLLVEVYLPAEADRLRALAPANAVQRDAAALQVLGATLADLGQSIARAWDLPERLQRCMLTPDGDIIPRRASAPGTERMRWLGRASQETAELLLSAPPAERWPTLILQLAQRYAGVLDIAPSELVAVAERMRGALPQWARALGLESALLAQPAAPGRRPAHAPAAVEASAVAILSAGVHDLTEALLAEPADLDALLRVLVETVYRAFRAHHVVLCLREPGSDELVGHHALGPQAEQASAAFRVPLNGATPDPFALLCSHGADSLIADARSSEIAARWPSWYRQHFDAGSLLLLPLEHQRRPLGLLYADKALPNSLLVGEPEWSLLRTLRNQALLALRDR